MAYQDLSKLSRPEMIELHQRIKGHGSWAHRAKKEELLAKLEEQDPATMTAALGEQARDKALQAQANTISSQGSAAGDPLQIQYSEPQPQGEPQGSEPQQSEPQGEPQGSEPQPQQEPIPETDDPLEQRVRVLARDEIAKAPGKGIDEPAVRNIAASVLADLRPPVRIEFKTQGKEPVKVEGQHPAMEALGTMVAAGLNVLMHGPAGSGKTTAAKMLAEAMGLPFGVVSLGPQTTQSQLFGYCDAVGNYIETEFRRRFEHGGILLLDEIDRASEKILPAANAAVDNGYCAFPDAMIEKHKDCYFLAAANTTMQGASRQYNSARKQDAAVIDRWAFLSWGYDLALEQAIAGAYIDGDTLSDWLAEVRAVRDMAEELGLDYVVSPRASRDGAKLISGGARDLARDCVLFGGWTPQDAERVKAAIIEKAGQV